MMGGGGFGATSGGFECKCLANSGTDDCTVQTAGPDIVCFSKGGTCTGCVMYTTIDPKISGIALTSDYNSTLLKPLVWKKVLLPIVK